MMLLLFSVAMAVMMVGFFGRGLSEDKGGLR